MTEEMTGEMKEELKEKAQAFLEAFKVLSKEHGFDFACELEVTPNGILPKLRIVLVLKPE